MENSINPYGKEGDATTKKIIDRILAQHYGVGKKEKTIGDMEDEILRLIHEKIQFIMGSLKDASDAELKHILSICGVI